jgi:hypothetical protein
VWVTASPILCHELGGLPLYWLISRPYSYDQVKECNARALHARLVSGMPAPCTWMDWSHRRLNFPPRFRPDLRSRSPYTVQRLSWIDYHELASYQPVSTSYLLSWASFAVTAKFRFPTVHTRPSVYAQGDAPERWIG